MKPETEAWLRRAEQDLGAAKTLLDAGFASLSVSLCHLAVEVLLKALWIEFREDLYERTHNLPYLAQKVGLELSAEQSEFLRKLYWQVIPTRYPEGAEPDIDAARWYYENTERIFPWLRQRLT